MRRFLDIQPDMKGILFCRTKRETQEITDELGQLGYEVEALHGDLSQAQRDAAMRRFKARNMQLLIATDVAARGIDVNDLTHVMHHKLPDQLEAYTHRSGRTGRAGNKGLSIAFINSREGRRIAEIERTLKVSFEKVEVPKSSELKQVRMENWVKQTLAMPVDKEAKEVLEPLMSKFERISKEDLLLRLISKELQQLKDSNKGDLNVSAEANSKGKSRRSDGPQRYFINLGTQDGLNKNDLLQFLSEVSGTKKGLIGDIAVQDKRSFFDLDQSQTKGFEQKFEGLELESGHPIRVNMENNRSQGGGGGRNRSGGGGRRQGGGKRFGGGNKRSGGGFNRNKSGRGRGK